jgi:iron complex outermembrane receptor protein
MKNLFVAFLISLLPIILSGQAGAPCYFHGRLLLSSDSTAFANAQIFASGMPILRGPIDVNLANSFSDSDGRFVLALKEPSTHLRIVTNYGDTLDISIEAITCNSIRDIFIAPNAPSSGIILNAITLEAYRNENLLTEIPASVAKIESATIHQNDQSSLQQSFNTVPGVTMESRGYGGSHRLSIRGSSLRSPFAVRNVKLYLDGIPLTSADGQTPLELIDAADIQSIEIIKGPAGSMYGNGNGGVLLMCSREVAPNTIKLSSAFQAASFSGFRWNDDASLGFKTSSLRISHNWQDYSGYRQQEFNRKQQVSLHFKQRISDTQRISIYGTYYNGNWGLPGALNPTQVDTMPQMAVPFSIANNAYLKRERYVAAITHEANWLNYFSERTTISYQRSTKTNPYGTSNFNSGYKDENSNAISGRTEWNYKQFANKFQWQLHTGAEWQIEQYSILEQTIDLSFPSTFKYMYDVGYNQLLGFLNGEIKYNNTLSIQGGYSYNTNSQFIRGRNADGFQFDTTTTYGSQWLPRIAASIRLAQGLYLFHSLSKGSANPTIFEMIDQANSTYNLNLRAEQGLSQELGIKQQLDIIGLSYSLTAYQFNLKDAILPYTITDGNGNGIQRYHNAGSTEQRGMEWSFSLARKTQNKRFNYRIWLAGSINRYAFKDYIVDEQQLNGKSIPGVPMAQASGGISFGSQTWNLNITDYWFDRTPLNNNNDKWSNPYHLLNVFVSYFLPEYKSFQTSISAGINNSLDAAYTSYYSLNAAALKYYNPSAPRNFFAGIQISYQLK